MNDPKADYFRLNRKSNIKILYFPEFWVFEEIYLAI